MNAFVPDGSPESFVKRLAHKRSRIQLEIARVHQSTGRCLNDQRRAFRDRVADGRKPNRKRAGLNGFRPGLHDIDMLAVVAVFFHLAPCVMCRKASRINRRTQTRPKMANGAHMIFMGMGDEDAFDPICARFQPFDVGKDQINAG